MYGGFFDNGGSGRAVKGESVKPYKCHFSHRRGIDVDVNVDSCLDNLNEQVEDANGNPVTINGKVQTKRKVLDAIAQDKLKAFKVREGTIHYRFLQ